MHAPVTRKVESRRWNEDKSVRCSYASRTKNIRNTPIINENSSYILLQQYTEEIRRLRAIINSSNIHLHSVSRSTVLNDVKLDDQHSIKTVCDRQISTETTPPIK